MNRKTVLFLVLFTVVLFAPSSAFAIYDVLWDTYHGINAGYSPADKFSDMKIYLESFGYTIHESARGIMAEDLTDYCVVVICLGSAWFSPYSTAEADTIEAYVNAGGSLLVFGENPTPPNSNINPITLRFGVRCGIALTSPTDLTCTRFASHQIFIGISSFYQEDGGPLAVTLPSVEACWEDPPKARPVGTTAEIGFGKVVILGDINSFDDTRLPMADNTLFCFNIFNWLCPIDAQPTPMPTVTPRPTPFPIPTGDHFSMAILLLLLSSIITVVVYLKNSSS